jgi:hypothetical protein
MTALTRVPNVSTESAIVLWLEGGAIKLIWSVINVRISRRI